MCMQASRGLSGHFGTLTSGAVRVLGLVSEQVLKRDSATLRSFSSCVNLFFPGAVEGELFYTADETGGAGQRGS